MLILEQRTAPPAGAGPTVPFAAADFVNGVLDALSASIAVLDSQGVIVAVNETWRAFAEANGDRHPRHWVGENYLAVCDRATGTDHNLGSAVSGGIRNVLAGADARFGIEYPCHGPAEKRWFLLTATPFAVAGETFVVAAHENITQRKLAEVKQSEHAAMLEALMAHVPEGITIASAPDVTIQYVSAHGLRRIQRNEQEVAGIGADEHPQAWQVYDETGTRMIAPDELPLTRATKAGEVVENERLSLKLPDGTLLPIQCNAGPIRAKNGDITGGVIVWHDVTEQVRAEEQRKLLVGELDHRIKNVFAVISSMIQLTASNSASLDEMAQALTGRIEALARAQELIRPAAALAAGSGDGKTSEVAIAELLRATLAPHAGNSADRLSLAGPEVAIGAMAASQLVLVLHELATNAAKYGAFSTGGGAVELCWTRDGDDIELSWRETGGPPLAAPPSRSGFGTRLVQSLVKRQFGGTAAHSWEPSGLRVDLRLPLRQLDS